MMFHSSSKSVSTEKCVKLIKCSVFHINVFVLMLRFYLLLSLHASATSSAVHFNGALKQAAEKWRHAEFCEVK